jgi:hypothetical protein
MPQPKKKPKPKTTPATSTLAHEPVDVPSGEATAGTGARQRGRPLAEERTYYERPDGTKVLVATPGRPLPDWYIEATKKSGGKRNVEQQTGPEETA